MFPGNLTYNGLPKSNDPHSAKHIILESYTDASMWYNYPEHWTLEEWYTNANNVLHSGTKNEVIILPLDSTQLGLLYELCSSRAAQCQHLDTVRKHSSDPKNLQQQQFTLFKTRIYLYTFSRPYSKSFLIQDHTTIHIIQDLKNMFLEWNLHPGLVHLHIPTRPMGQ